VSLRKILFHGITEVMVGKDKNSFICRQGERFHWSEMVLLSWARCYSSHLRRTIKQRMVRIPLLTQSWLRPRQWFY